MINFFRIVFLGVILLLSFGCGAFLPRNPILDPATLKVSELKSLQENHMEKISDFVKDYRSYRLEGIGFTHLNGRPYLYIRRRPEIRRELYGKRRYILADYLFSDYVLSMVEILAEKFGKPKDFRGYIVDVIIRYEIWAVPDTVTTFILDSVRCAEYAERKARAKDLFRATHVYHGPLPFPFPLGTSFISMGKDLVRGVLQ